MRTDEETKSIFNEKLYELTENDKLLSNNYITSNSAIILAAQEKTTKERKKNQGWFHHSELILLPVIQHQDHLLHHIRSKDPSEYTTTIKDELKSPKTSSVITSPLLKLPGPPTKQKQFTTCTSHQNTHGTVWRYYQEVWRPITKNHQWCVSNSPMANWPQLMLKMRPSWGHTWKRFTETTGRSTGRYFTTYPNKTSCSNLTHSSPGNNWSNQ